MSNKYELNFLQWITGLPRKICKQITKFEVTPGNGYKILVKVNINIKDWRFIYGTSALEKKIE